VVRRLDLLIAKSAFEREAIGSAVVVDLGVDCLVARPEHLVVYKLIAGRPRDLGDAEDILRTRKIAGEPVDLSTVRRWAREWEVESRLEDILARLDVSLR